MVTLITGTFIESYHGADAAKITVYDTWWFGLMLLILALNVLAAALDRLPWKKKHVGFVLTHAGIIVILFGSFVSRQSMIDGQMAIEEGDTESRITLSEPLIYVFSDADKRDWIVPVRKKAFAWQGNQSIVRGDKNSAGLPLTIDLLSFYPKARVHEELAPAEDGPGAVKVRIKNSFLDQSMWLVENDPGKGEIQMGPATFSFKDKPLVQANEIKKDEDYLEIKLNEDTFQIPLKVEASHLGEETLTLPYIYPLGDSGYRVKLNKLYQKAAVVGKELIDQTEPDAKKNPAAQLTLMGPDLIENHTVFANFPDFPTVHGMKPSAVGASIYYRLPGGGSEGESHELRFVKGRDTLQYQIQDGAQLNTGEVVVGEAVSTGWMDLTFTVEEYFSHSTFKHDYTPMENTTEFEGATSAIQVRVTPEVPVLKVPGSGQAEKNKPGTFRTGTTVWLGQGVMEKIKMGDTTYHLMYGKRRVPTGFNLQLKDFKIETYPGTEDPASYKSDVVLMDETEGVRKNITISMNEPLEYKGFKVYQSGYNLDGDKEVSIFSVGKNPGIPYQYAGTIIMVIGISTMYYTRKFSRTGGKL